MEFIEGFGEQGAHVAFILVSKLLCYHSSMQFIFVWRGLKLFENTFDALTFCFMYSILILFLNWGLNSKKIKRKYIFLLIKMPLFYFYWFALIQKLHFLFEYIKFCSSFDCNCNSSTFSLQQSIKILVAYKTQFANFMLFYTFYWFSFANQEKGNLVE